MKFNDQQLVDDLRWRDPTNEELSENDSILGVIEGQHFVPGGTSRNVRYYGQDLWDKACVSKEVVRRVETRTMFGTIGHDIEISEKELREGLVSHYTIDLNSKTGFARSFILNTNAGRLLKVYHKAGCRLYTSSRADGTYKGKLPDGTPIMDPNRYYLERFDFVIEPGFLEAEPKLKESLDEGMVACYESLVREKQDKDNDQNSDPETKYKDSLIVKGDGDMDGKDKSKGGASTESLGAVDELLTAQKTLTQQVESLKQEQASMREKLDKYEALGTPEELKSASDRMGSFLESHGGGAALAKKLERLRLIETEIGSYEDLSSLMSGFSKFVSTYGGLKKAVEAISSNKDLNKSLESLTQEFGALSAEKLTLEKTLEQIGSVEDITNFVAAVEGFTTRFGTLQSVEERLANQTRMIESLELESRVLRLSAQCGVDEAKIREMITTGLSNEAIVSYYKTSKSRQAEAFIVRTELPNESLSKKVEGHSPSRLSSMLESTVNRTSKE